MSAVAVRRLWKFFGDFPVLRDISLTVDAGQCLALLGRNGAGKTTLLRILGGLSLPTKGEAEIFTHRVRDPATRRRIGVLGHGIGVYDELTAFENLMLFGKLYELPDPRRAALEWLERTSLSQVGDSRVREFSRGMRQRLAVARTFLHDPDLLLLDEPFTSLDDRAIALLQDLLRGVLAKGKTVILSTHQLREALELATHVALVDRGKLAHAGPRTPDMLEDPGWLYRTYSQK